MAVEEQTPTIEGMLEVRRETKRGRGYVLNQTLRSIEGVIKGMEEKELKPRDDNPFQYPDSVQRYLASVVNRPEIRLGVSMTLENSSGITEVEFPRSFGLLDKKALIGQRVKYNVLHEEFSEGIGTGTLTTHKYTMKFLSGQLEGEEIKAKAP